MSLDRLSAMALLVFALAMILAVIPANTETVDYGLAPSWLPIACSVVIALAAALHLALPTGGVEIGRGEAARTAGFLAIAVAGVVAMQHLGFLAGACGMALAAMLAGGERRPLWLIAGGGVVPVAVWALVEQALGRPLP